MIFAISAEELLDTEVENLLKWYNRRSKETSEYEFPSDVRMYEAEDKSYKVKLFIYVRKSIYLECRKIATVFVFI